MAADTTISSECCFHTSFKFSTSLNVLVTVQPPSSVECNHLLASKSSYRTDPTAQCAYVRMYGAGCAVNARLSSRSFGMLNDFTIIQTFQ